MLRTGLIAALLALALPATAGDVVSAGPGAVSVTIYRDEAIPDPAAAEWDGYGLAMISETRTVDLPAGESRLVLQGVADGALPETAAIEGLPGRIVEQNFDYDLLSPGSLIQHSLGEPVQIVRINPRTGKRAVEDAVLRSGPQGVVVDAGGRIEALGCSGGIERLVFASVPPELTGKAALSTRIRVDKPGRYQIRLAYLAVGLAWKSSYVARVSPDAKTLDLTGWITLANHGDTGFANAPTSVVAGRLARQAVNLAQRIVARHEIDCWPMGNSHHPQGDRMYLAEREAINGGRLEEENMAVPARAMMKSAVDEVMVTARRRATESNLGDYKLYTIDEPTNVAARQTKQVLFLHQAGVKFDRVYVFKFDPGAAFANEFKIEPTVTTLRLTNKAENGLGRALPAGQVSVRQPKAAGGTDFFIGQPDMRDVAVGEPVELEIGEASDVRAGWEITDLTRYKDKGRDGERITVQVTLSNAKSEDVVAEFRHRVSHAGFKIIAESQAHGTKAGDPVWRVNLPANGETSVTYTAEYLID